MSEGIIRQASGLLEKLGITYEDTKRENYAPVNSLTETPYDL